MQLPVVVIGLCYWHSTMKRFPLAHICIDIHTCRHIGEQLRKDFAMSACHTLLVATSYNAGMTNCKGFCGTTHHKWTEHEPSENIPVIIDSVCLSQALYQCNKKAAYIFILTGANPYYSSIFLLSYTKYKRQSTYQCHIINPSTMIFLKVVHRRNIIYDLHNISCRKICHLEYKIRSIDMIIVKLL